jgi:CheY-like chemotaxis protein
MTGLDALTGCRILVVEDELIVALDICEHLKDLGCEIIGPAGSVKKALALMETQTPDLALLDQNLAGETVLPVAETLKRRNIPFAIASGYNSGEADEAVLQEVPRIAKPASNEDIAKALSELVGRK